MEPDDDAKSVAVVGDDGHWYLNFSHVKTTRGSCGILSMVLYRIASGTHSKNMASAEEIFTAVETKKWGF